VRIFLAIGFLLFFWESNAQVRNHPMSMLYRLEGERMALMADSDAVTSFYPLNSSRVSLDSAFYYAYKRKYYFAYQEKVLRDPLFYIKGQDFQIGIDPVYDFRFGKDFGDTSAYADTVQLVGNTRGLRIEVDFGKNISIQTSFYENQAHLPLYLYHYANATGVVPGMGRHKKFKSAGFDYAASYGWINWRLKPWLRLELGHGKHFIGNGYRSMLLSDMASAYPYLKGVIESPNRKWAYHTMGVKLQSLERQPKGEVPESLFKQKNATFHYLTFKPARWLEVGLFEGTIWPRWDDSTGTTSPQWGMYVPIIGLSSAQINGAGSFATVQGLNFNTGSKRIRLYGQAGFTRAKWTTHQFGFKLFDLPLSGLVLQTEYNSASSSDFLSNASDLNAYNHLNENLGHREGSNFQEFVVIAHFHRKRWLGMFKFNYVERLTPPSSFIDTSPASRTQIYEASLGYLINPNSGASFRMGYTNRNHHFGTDVSKTNFVFWSFSTLLWQSYSDF